MVSEAEYQLRSEVRALKDRIESLEQLMRHVDPLRVRLVQVNPPHAGLGRGGNYQNADYTDRSTLASGKILDEKKELIFEYGGEWFFLAGERWVIGEMTVDILPGETQAMTRLAGYDSGGLTVNVKLDFFHGGQKISSGKKVAAKWFYDLDVYLIMHAECE